MFKKFIIVAVIIILFIAAIGEKLNFGAKKASTSAATAKKDSSYKPQEEELSDMMLADAEAFAALMEVGTRSQVNAHQEYKFQVYGKLYVNDEYINRYGKDEYKWCIEQTSDRQGFHMFAYLRDYKVETAPLREEYVLSWQDVYTMAITVFIEEKGQETITAAQIREIADMLSPEIGIENAKELKPNLEWLAEQKNPVSFSDEHIAWAAISQKGEVYTEIEETSMVQVPVGSPEAGGAADEDGDGYVTVEVTEKRKILKSYMVEREPEISTHSITTWTETNTVKEKYVDIDGEKKPAVSISRTENYGHLAKMQEKYGLQLEDVGAIGDLIEDDPDYEGLAKRIESLSLVSGAAYGINVTLSQAHTLAEMSWPLPGDYRVGSKFGPRVAPIEGASTFHKGFDIGAQMGAPIVASLAGTVITAYYGSPDAGNYIEIDHGDGVVTRYLHCSELLVKRGDTVLQNDKIALAGSTGVSTAPHLHYCVVINGTYVDPGRFLPDPKQAEAEYEGTVIGHAK